MQPRHIDREKYFCEQNQIAEKVLVPYIDSKFPVSSETSVIEIGCGEAGNLYAFLAAGCSVTGIDCSAIRIERARNYYSSHPLRKNLSLIACDIFEIDPNETGTFDLIILRDSLEHISNQEKLLAHLKKFLNHGGRLFISFPPWQMPFGGHQQLCENRFLSRLPYFHLLPKPAYIALLKVFSEKPYRIDELLAIRNTRITIERFKKLVTTNSLAIEREDFYFINPAYQVKFKLKPRRLFFLFNIQHLRNFYTTACYFLLSVK